ncbi:MAG: hypothetical protein HQL24_06775 [Candidatus Omnitrophica bacterium]|nr:hypothetical protein [Candidatus Omnitrophota bacterium]
MLSNEENQIIEGKMFALLSYLSIFCIIPLVLKKENPFVLAHGKQGLVIFVAQVGIFVIHIVLGSLFLRLGFFVFGILSLMGIIHVLRGRYIKIPVIYEIAQKIIL